MSAPGTFFFKTGTDQPNFSVETCIRAFEPLRPYPQNPSAIIYRARFLQLRAYYTRPAVNTPHPDLPQVYFADDVDFQDKLGGAVEWTRVWNTIPASWTDFESTSYSYPGFLGTRVPLTRTVTGRLTYDYYLVGTLPTFSDLLTNYDNFAAVSWTKSGATAATNATNVPVCAGGTTVAAKLTEDSNASTHEAYQGTANAAGVFSGTVFLKAAERTKARVGIGNNVGTALFADLVVDLATGTPSNVNAATNYWVAAIGEGWWRVDLTGTAANSNAALVVMLADANGATNYTGDGASGLYAWRGQLVAGNAIPHATVPPTTTPDGANYPVQTADLIPVKFGQLYLYNLLNISFEYLSNATTPTYANYNANVLADLNANSYSIEANDSLLSLWDGSTWARQRRFVKAR